MKTLGMRLNYFNSLYFFSTIQALKELYLGGNKIGDNGAQQLSEALKVNQVSDRSRWFSQ